MTTKYSRNPPKRKIKLNLPTYKDNVEIGKKMRALGIPKMKFNPENYEREK